MATTFDPANTDADITLSNGNLTATASAAVDNSDYSRCTTSNSSGKFYFEATYTTVAGQLGMGLVRSVFVLGSNFIGGDASRDSLCLYAVQGALIYENAIQESIGTAPVSGTVYGFAVDLDNSRFWAKKLNNGGSDWNGVAAADPATNTGGITLPAGSWFPAADFQGDSSGGAITVNVSGSGYTGTAPTGFGTWDPPSPPEPDPEPTPAPAPSGGAGAGGRTRPLYKRIKLRRRRKKPEEHQPAPEEHRPALPEISPPSIASALSLMDSVPPPMPIVLPPSAPLDDDDEEAIMLLMEIL